MSEDLRKAKVFVAGHRGMVGAALVRQLERQGYVNLLTAARNDIDLTNQASCNEFFDRNRPEVVLLAAAKVGGIVANASYPAQFLYDNLMIEANIIHASFLNGVRKLLFLGSTCIYPRDAPQPLKEEYLMTGPLESTNEAYAVAKIAGIKLCQAYRRQYGVRFIAAMPTNLYGPGDNYDLEASHVLPALIRRFHEAASRADERVVLWGTGRPRREFCHVDDCAEACIYLLERYDDAQIVNIGVGRDIEIAELAALVAEIVGFKGRIEFDHSRPDGTPRKLVDITRLSALGWKAGISLRDGINRTYRDYLREHHSAPSR